MANQVVTELVIDADTAGADQFAQSMDRANSSAKDGSSSVAGLTLAVAGVGVAFVGSLAALRGFVDFVGNTNKQLVDLGTNAANAGMSTKQFQETLFAAKSAGLSDKDFVSGLDKIGADLTAASRGATDFGKLFEANGLSIKNANGELKTTQQALGDISTLIRNAPTPAIANGVAQIAGLSKDWVGFLKESTAELDAQKQSAAALGVVIDDATVQKAKAFNDQWHTAIAGWDLQLKAALASILPLLIQLANIASQVINTVGTIGSFFSRALTPQDQWSTSDLQKQLDGLKQYKDLVSSLGDSATSFQLSRARGQTGVLGITDSSDIDAEIAKTKQLIDARANAARIVVTPSQGNGSTVLPPTGADSNDAVDRAIITLQRHTAQQVADTNAVGLGSSALAQFRAEAALASAVQANGGTATAEQKAQFEGLAKAVGDAALALEKAKVANDNKFGANTAFLSAGDVQIASQLKQIYPEVTTALNSAEAAQMRFNAAAKEVSSAIETDLTSGLTDIVSGTKSVSAGFSDMATAVIKAIEQMIIKIMIVQPLMQALQQAAGGLGGLGNFLGLGGGAPTTVTSLGAGTGGLPYPAFASGTDSAPGGWSVVGENGPELLNLTPGARVVPNGGFASNDNGGGGRSAPNIIINNHTDATPTTATNSNGDITITFKKMVDDMVGQSLSTGTGMRVLSKQYGVNQFAGQ